MGLIIAITTHANIKSPALQRVYKNVVVSILKQVAAAVEKEVGAVIEGLEGAVNEVFEESKGGAK